MGVAPTHHHCDVQASDRDVLQRPNDRKGGVIGVGSAQRHEHLAGHLRDWARPVPPLQEFPAK